MGLDEAAVDVGAGNGLWIVLFTWMSGGIGVIIGGLVAGKSGNDMSEMLKMGIIC